MLFLFFITLVFPHRCQPRPLLTPPLLPGFSPHIFWISLSYHMETTLHQPNFLVPLILSNDTRGGPTQFTTLHPHMASSTIDALNVQISSGVALELGLGEAVSVTELVGFTLYRTAFRVVKQSLCSD
ncbi:hypothetical protein BDM02DRAFT_287350 [Thelephora ganbajun]|uniref:Uncharacterized protein n=1 Tax=Thelephora ganbajun TaxID=370292 RepID=A0ACB6Z9X6_THEGA|nr:hypothetical protein BDM02DRAFT_287350 [Thelephora ganbajun]